MNILVISDTHRELQNLKIAVKEVKNFSQVYFLGDCEGDEADIRRICAPAEVLFVRGNCDWQSTEPLLRFVDMEGVTVLLTHGHGYEPAQLAAMAQAAGAKVICRGHTHRPEVIEKGGLLWLNPGSLSEPRQASARPSYAILTRADDGTLCAKTVEMTRYWA